MARSYESNGPDVKIRGTALHIAEKYLQLARDAQSSGDRVGGENYLQHAEHYFRIVAAAQAQMPQAQPAPRNDSDDSDDEDRSPPNEADRGSSPQPFVQQSFGLTDPQPFLNGNNGRGDGEDGGNGAAEARQDGREERDGREQGGGGSYRGRRRRPYRDRSSSESSDASGGDTRSETAASED